MSQSAAITGVVTITVNSVAKQFNNVILLSFDYFKGMVNVVDATQGSFFFSIAAITTVTYTINGTTSTIVLS